MHIPTTAAVLALGVLHIPTAAAVLALGVLQLSPMPKTLLYLVCCIVSRVTVRKPVAGSTRALDRSASGVDIGGVMCKKLYCNKPRHGE